MSIRSMRAAYRLSKDLPAQRGILATLAASFTFAFLLSFKQGSLLSVAAELFSFAILIEKQSRLLANEESGRCRRRSTKVNTSQPIIKLQILCLEHISKWLQEHGDAHELDKSSDIPGVVLPAYQEPSLPPELGKTPFDEPATFIPT